MNGVKLALGSVAAFVAGGLVVNRGSLNSDELSVVDVRKIRAGNRGADMVKAAAMGRMHDPHKTVQVEVTITGPPDRLLSEQARTLSIREARKYMFGTWSRRVSNIYQDSRGRPVVRFIVQ